MVIPIYTEKEAEGAISEALDSFGQPGGTYDGLGEVICSWIRHYPDLVSLVISRFNKSDRDDLKEFFALIILKVRPERKYANYLKMHHEFTDQDFESMGIPAGHFID
jgi:hypothetical protein